MNDDAFSVWAQAEYLKRSLYILTLDVFEHLCKWGIIIAYS